jgi:hypothetical protein
MIVTVERVVISLAPSPRPEDLSYSPNGASDLAMFICVRVSVYVEDPRGSSDEGRSVILSYYVVSTTRLLKLRLKSIPQYNCGHKMR